MGCADLKVPSNMYTKREGERTTVTCNQTGEVSVLTCAGAGWEGVVKNCSKNIGEFQAFLSIFPSYLLKCLSLYPMRYIFMYILGADRSVVVTS